MRDHLEYSNDRGTRSVFLETFGCQMNVLDSQLVRGQLEGLGYHFTDDWKEADIVLYNTCSVREHAEQKVWSRLGRLGAHKRRRSKLIVGVIGCMAEREGVDMMRRYPQVDLLCGPGELDKLPLLIDNAVRTEPAVALQGNTHRRSATLDAVEDSLELLDLSRAFDPNLGRADGPAPAILPGGSAYVRITRGCNKFCTYCVVPRTRGREVHRPPQHILDECRALVQAGAVEITLLGQTVNHYHYDHAAAIYVNGVRQPQIGAVIAPGMGTGGAKPKFRPGVTSFAQLLAQIHDQIPQLQRLRFVTSFPRDFGDDILEVIRDRPRICRYLHLPVQSGSNRILGLMNRGYTVEQYLDLIDRVRTYLPDAQIASDVICGFPTETEQDHLATVDLLRRCLFKNCFVFKYSPRPGTAADHRLPDDVPNPVKKWRNNDLLSNQSKISAEVHDRHIGRTLRVLVESVSPKQRKATASIGAAPGSVELGWERSSAPITSMNSGQLTGRTSGDLIVCFNGPRSLIGCVVDVTIERASTLTMFGRLVDE